MKLNEETLTCAILNQSITADHRAHKLFEDAEDIAKFLQNRFPGITSATSVGQTFANRGDLILNLQSGRTIELELKRLTSRGFLKGTLANTSQDILAQQKISKLQKGWSGFRAAHGYDGKIVDILNSVGITQQEIDHILSTEKVIHRGSQIETKARALRQRIYNIADHFDLSKKAMRSLIRKIKANHFKKLTNSEQQAVSAIDKILRIAEDDLSSYLSKVAEQGFNNDKLKQLLACLKYGYHTEQLLSENMGKSIAELEASSENYFIVYFYPSSTEDTLRFKIEGPEQIKTWIDYNEDIEALVKGESVWVMRGEKKILQLKFHWRNVFFGIATPSVEIFDKVKHQS